ncbi:lipopolysaccharide heptosyltransferase family protein [bacterium]|nr:MAG: lipopolysaccharide heptosyltransferase family protein [bacterium]
MPRFLVARLSSLGDVVCSLPAASALKEGFPDATIEWVVDPRFAAIVDRCASVDKVIRWKPSWRPLKHEGRFDAALDLQGLLKSGLAIGRAQADQKVGYHWQREGAWLFSARVLPDPSSHHVVDQYVDVARAVGGVGDRAEFALKPTEDDVLKVRRKLKEGGLVGRFVALNPGAGWASKRWPPASCAAFIDALAASGMPTVLIGGKDSLEAAEEISALTRERPVSLVGATDLGELIALIRLASCHVGSDTGSTHLSAAVGTAAVGLYSLTRPQRSCPYGQIERCLRAETLTEIPPEAVTERVLAALG